MIIDTSFESIITNFTSTPVRDRPLALSWKSCWRDLIFRKGKQPDYRADNNETATAYAVYPGEIAICDAGQELETDSLVTCSALIVKDDAKKLLAHVLDPADYRDYRKVCFNLRRAVTGIFDITSEKTRFFKVPGCTHALRHKRSEDSTWGSETTIDGALYPLGIFRRLERLPIYSDDDDILVVGDHGIAIKKQFDDSYIWTKDGTRYHGNWYNHDSMRRLAKQTCG